MLLMRLSIVLNLTPEEFLSIQMFVPGVALTYFQRKKEC